MGGALRPPGATTYSQAAGPVQHAAARTRRAAVGLVRAKPGCYIGAGPPRDRAMTTDESQFETLAEAWLRRAGQAIEDASEDVDVELQGGVLTAELDDGRAFLLNKHAPLRQLWLSSPISGASHYRHADGGWRSTRDGRELAAVLVEDFAHAGIALDLEG